MKKRMTLVWLSIISAIIFILILLGVNYSNNFFLIDKSVSIEIQGIQNNFLTSLFRVISYIFDPISMIILSLLISVFLWIKNSKKEATFFFLVMLFGGAAIFILKEIINRTRPLNALIFDSGFSFPSGHATTAVIFFGLLIYLISKRKISKNTKILTASISIFMVLLISFSRIYLNVHYLTDVLAGFFLGAFILTLGIIIKEG